MIKVIKNPLLLTVIFLLVGFSPSLRGQDKMSFDDQTKLIRIKKIANEWQGAILTIHTRDGESIEGRLIEVSGGNYQMEVNEELIEVPMEDVTMVSFEPGIPELILTLASSLMGGAFLSGAILLANEDSSPAAVTTAGLLGLVAGGLWGYSTFYESEVIHLE